MAKPGEEAKTAFPFGVTTSSGPISLRVEGNSRSNKNGRWALNSLLTSNLETFLLRNNEESEKRDAGDCQSHCRPAKSCRSDGHEIEAPRRGGAQ